MASQEAFTLDGLALNDQTNFAVESVSWPPPAQRQNWIGAADSEAQALFRKPLHENRKVTLRVGVIPQSTMDLALAKVAQVVDKLDKAGQSGDGIALVWTPATATLSCTFDVLAGEVTDLPIDWENGWLALAPTFIIELTCKPYWRGSETLTSTATTSTPFQTLAISGVTGDIPALGRLIVTDAATQSRRHVEWGLEGPLTYNASTSLLVDSDDMVTSGFSGAQATTTGAYDPNATGNNSISLSLAAGTTTALCGTGNLSHVGVFRAKAHVQSGSLSNQFRLTWKSGDGAASSNAWVPTITTTGWQDLDLGSITIPAATLGTQRWTGQVEVLAAASSPGTAVVDYLILIPQTDGYGKARASYTPSTGTLAGQDAFVGTTAGSALNTRTAPLGGAWATSGDTTDFAFADQFTTGDGVESIVRSTTATETTGRFAILGTTNYADSQIDVRAKFSTGTFNEEQTAILRWTDSSNYVRFVVPKAGTVSDTARLEQVVAGAVTVLDSRSFKWSDYVADAPNGTRYRIRFAAFPSGRVLGFLYDNAGTTLFLTLDGSSTAVATGGTLATGKPGLRDRVTGSGAINRYFTEFTVSVPPAEPIAIYSGRTMEIRYDDTIRQDSTGAYYGRPSSYRGSRFLVPVGTSRVLVKARRNDVDTAPDANVTDSTTIQVGWTPRGLVVPR